MNNKKIILWVRLLIASEYLEFLIKNKIHISAVYSQPPKKNQEE